MSDTKGLLPYIKLQFNIEHPTLEEAYQYGYECALAEIAEEDNPFAIGSNEYEQWHDGWWSGFYGEDSLFAKETEESEILSANDHVYHDSKENLFFRFLEISGVIAVSAFVGYQLFELVA